MSTKKHARLLEGFVRDLPHMNAEKLTATLERISDFGIEKPRGPVRRPGILCPFTEMQIVSPCSLNECKHFIENEWARNCVLEYLEKQGGDSLAVEEISFLYNTPVEDVVEIIAQGMAKLRENSEETVGFSGDFNRSKAPEIELRANEDDKVKVTLATLAPSFLETVNSALESSVPADLVFKHKAVRLLGVLDAIISELE